jgi:2-methylisocitrate lyase-like PEP mutase family enzyme
MSSQREKAEELRRLHAAPEPLVLVNAWDAVSARVVAGAPGARAIATASWSIAAARGLPDGEALSREAMVEAVAVVARAVELPVTADLERGYGDVRLTIESALEAGAVGCNLEDSDGKGGLWPAAEHAAVVAAARAAGDAAGIPLVINARTDVYLEDVIPPDERLVAALERGAAYLEAGADCIFVPGVRDLETLEALAKDMGGPVSVLGGAGGPALAELARIGIARVSYGPGPLGVAMAALSRAAETLLAGGDPPADLAFRP